jgi:hypothetical protein
MGNLPPGVDTAKAMGRIAAYADIEVICLQDVPDSLKIPILKLDGRIGRVMQSGQGVNSVMSLKKDSVRVTYPLSSSVVMPPDSASRGTYLRFLTLTFKGYSYFVSEYEGSPGSQDPSLVKQSELLLSAFKNIAEKVVLLVNLHTAFKNIGMRILEQQFVNAVKAKGLASEGVSVFVSKDVIVKDLRPISAAGANLFFGDCR